MVGALLLGFVSTTDAEDGRLVGGLRKTVCVRERERGGRAIIPEMSTVQRFSMSKLYKDSLSSLLDQVL
jgi:hypothetical protein